MWTIDLCQLMRRPRPSCARPDEATRKQGAASLSGRRVLVVGINYWPEQTGIAPYTTGMAEYLIELGASVKVLTGIPHYPAWRVTPYYRWRLASRERRLGVEVVRLRHTVPRRMTAARRLIYESTFLVHATLRGLREQPDLILAASPALGGAIAGASVARRVGCPLVVIVQDLMAQATAQSGISGGGRLTGLTARLEGATLRAATLVTVVSDSFRGEVEAYGVPPQRIALFRNWTHILPSPMRREEARGRLGWTKESFLAVHTGNMGYKQDLGNVIDAARLLRGSEIGIVLVGDGSQRAELEHAAEGLENVQFVDLVDPALYPAVLAAADVLLVNERPTVGEMSLPSKITSYLAAGQPVVAAVSDGGASQRELSSTGGAALIVPPGQPAALAESLRGLRGDQGRLREMGRAASVYAADHFARDAALRTLSDLLLTVVPEVASSRA
jgi:colanic acid biosynthesis glycosyl transferase WcaI